MDCISKVLEKLSFRDIVPLVGEYDLSWVDNAGTEHYIQLNNMDCSGGNLAWFQSSEKDEYVLRVYENDTVFNWQPISHNLYFGCTCSLLEWYKDHLIFIYTEKHDTYICSIRDQQVSTFNFNGGLLERKENLIFFREYQDGATVRRIRIPELEEIEPITEQQAQAEGVLPEIIIQPNGLKTNNKPL